ncbi:hypothetical protein SteCoe_24804 [Stentor coeruleus]|uniref:Uncharacterized protein n=1 Tax=Stentor coeruleus TaxID=5963 RepID=A0A1R2BGQ0_9CILI|nr:hypothetical protein SteCoe_24804 [Stentor coeruleus]
MEGSISRLEIYFVESQNIVLSKGHTIKIYVRDQAKLIQHPFSTSVIFDVEGVNQGEPMLLSVEEKNEEIGIGDFKATSTEQWVNLSSKDKNECGRVKVSVHVMSIEDAQMRRSPEKLPTEITDCPRCSYLQKISESQQNELLSLEEHKSTYSDIKQIIKEYYSVDHIPYASKYIPDIEELGVDLPAPCHGKSSQITKQEADHLKEVIIGLTEKLKVLQLVQDEVKTLRQQLYDSHVNRLNLQTTIKENTEQLEAKCKEQCKKHLDINEDRSKAMQSLLDQQHVYAQKCLEVDQLKSDLSTLNANLQQLKAEQYNFNTMKDHVSRLEAELKESSGKRDDLNNEHKKTLDDFSASKTRQNANIENLNKEKLELLDQIDEINKQILSQKHQNEGLNKENTELEKEIRQLEGEINSLVDENKEIEHSRQAALEKEEHCIKLHRDIHEAAQKFESELENLSKLNTQLLKEKTNVMDELNKLENILENKTEEVQDLTRNNYSSLAQCTILEQQICIQNDQYEIRKTIESQTEVNEKIKDILLEEIGSMGEQLKKQSEECLLLSKSVENFKKILDGKNQEKNELLRIVEELKQVKPVYVPVRGEQVDELLAEVLNGRTDWLSIEMKRESQGSYSFGSKNIDIFIENNGLMVKCGKAIMAIDEFLKTYIPIEIHKKQLTKPESKLSTKFLAK